MSSSTFPPNTLPPHHGRPSTPTPTPTSILTPPTNITTAPASSPPNIISNPNLTHSSRNRSQYPLPDSYIKGSRPTPLTRNKTRRNPRIPQHLQIPETISAAGEQILEKQDHIQPTIDPRRWGNDWPDPEHYPEYSKPVSGYASRPPKVKLDDESVEEGYDWDDNVKWRPWPEPVEYMGD
ncbi:hypothetical protein EG329_011461 [Mollisiaceae sp. DMI_Dod_QoI]|nr:hypothetical protein EG329_011461 [Helotiales sp. DMI_Dod_QoI]